MRLPTRPHVSRRRVALLAVLVTVGLLSVSVVAPMAPGSEHAGLVSADMDGLSVQGATGALADAPEEVILDVSGSWSMTGGSEDDVDQLRSAIYLTVDGEREMLREEVVFSPAPGDTGDIAFSEDMLAHDALAASDFDVEEGESTAIDATAELEIRLIAGSDTIETESFESAFTMGNEHPNEALSASVDAEGSVEFVE